MHPDACRLPVAGPVRRSGAGVAAGGATEWCPRAGAEKGRRPRIITIIILIPSSIQYLLTLQLRQRSETIKSN